MLFDEPPKARLPTGERVPTCGYPRFCQARKLALALGEDGLRRAVEMAPEELLEMTVKSMGLQPKSQRAYGLLRARIAKMPKAPLHCVTWMLASEPIVVMADIVDAATGITLEDIANGIVVEAEIEKAMRAGAIVEWCRHFSVPHLRVAVETMWDQGYYGLDARDEFLDILSRYPDVGKAGTTGEDQLKAGGRRRGGGDASAGAVAAFDVHGEGDGEVQSSLGVMLGRAVAEVEVALATGSDPGLTPAGVEWLLGLDPGSGVCWMAHGRLTALLGHPERGAPPPEGVPWFIAGRILGHHHRGEGDAVAALAADPEVPGLVASPPAPGLVAAVLGSVVSDARLSARLLAVAGEPFDGWESYVGQVRSQVERFLEKGAGADAELLLGAVEEVLSRWTAGLAGSDMTVSPEADMVSLLRVTARRRLGDFAGASRLLVRVDRARLEPETARRALFEAAMIRAELRAVEQLPAEMAGDRRRLRERLDRARSDLDLLLDSDPGHWEANACRGLLACLAGDDAGAVWHLSSIPESSATDPALASLVVFQLALCRLRLLDPQTLESAARALGQAVEGGHEPDLADLVAVAEALDAHGSREVGAWLARAVQHSPRSEPVTRLVVDNARKHDQGVHELAEAMGLDAGRKLAERFDLLAAALAGTEAAGDAEGVDRLVGHLDEVVARVNRPEIDARWADMLATDDALRTALEPAHADAVRVEVLRRCGRHPEALGVAKALFYRAAAGSLAGFDAAELLEVVGELGEEPGELDRLGHLVRSHPGTEASPDEAGGSVRVLFVGGNESQEAYRSSLEAEMADRYGADVSVEWFFAGWTSNWNKVAEKVELAYPEADAVVLMTFVRTNFGRWVRRTTGERGIPWVACTGHGRTALAHAIHRAVSVARSSQADPGTPA